MDADERIEELERRVTRVERHVGLEKPVPAQELLDLGKRLARSRIGDEQSPEALFALGKSYANRDKAEKAIVPKGWEGK